MYKKIISESTETFDAFTKTLNILSETIPSDGGTETDFISGTMTENEDIQIEKWKKEKQKIEFKKMVNLILVSWKENMK